MIVKTWTKSYSAGWTPADLAFLSGILVGQGVVDTAWLSDHHVGDFINIGSGNNFYLRLLRESEDGVYEELALQIRGEGYREGALPIEAALTEFLRAGAQAHLVQ